MSVVTFDGAERLITVDFGITDIDVKTDLYSDWKEWQKLGNNTGYAQAMRAVGGDPLPGSKALGSTFFLMNGWKIRSWEGSHTLTINGNLYTEDGTSPIIPTIGNYNVMIISAVSQLVDSTVQQLPEIEYASFDGAIHIDQLNGTDSDIYPYGTPASPCKTMANVAAIRAARGFNVVEAIGLCVLGVGTSTGLVYTGLTEGLTTYDLDSHLFNECTFKHCELSGSATSGSTFHVEHSHVGDLNNVTVDAHDSVLTGTISLEGNSNFYRCTDGVPGSGTPIVQGNTSTSIGFWNYSGGLKLTNITAVGCAVSVNFNAGRLIVDGTDTQGSLIVRGVGSLSGTTGGTAVDQSGLLDRNTIANALLALADGVETGFTVQEALRVISSVLAGKASGFPSGLTKVFRDVNDTKDRVTATTDGNGNRTTVVLDPN